MLSDKEFENIIRESIREEIALLKEGKQTLYIWSEDGGRTYGLYDKLTGSKKVPLVKGNEKTMMQLLLKISNAPKSDLEDEFSETAQGDQYGEIAVDMNKLAKLKSMVKEYGKKKVTENKYDDMLKKGDGHVHFVVKDLATAEKLADKIEAKYGSTDYYKLSDGKVYLRVAPDYYEGKYIPAIERLVGQKAKPGSKETGHVKGKVVQEATSTGGLLTESIGAVVVGILAAVAGVAAASPKAKKLFNILRKAPKALKVFMKLAKNPEIRELIRDPANDVAWDKKWQKAVKSTITKEEHKAIFELLGIEFYPDANIKYEAALEKEKFTDPDQMRMYEAKTISTGDAKNFAKALAKNAPEAGVIKAKAAKHNGEIKLFVDYKSHKQRRALAAAGKKLGLKYINDGRSTNRPGLDYKRGDKMVGGKGVLGISKNWMVFIKEGVMNEAFKPGDTWSKDFDYTGMLKFGSKVKINTSLKVLEALYDSFEDVNYHSENAHLGDAISSLLAKKPNDAKKHMNVFNKACLNTLKSVK